MRKRFKAAFFAATCLSILPLSAPSMAANRAFNAFSALPETPACFPRASGNPLLTNTCSFSTNVFLPMSVDNSAGYSVSVYGQGVITSGGGHNTIWCTSNTVTHDNSALFGGSWATLPNNSSYGGSQVLTIPPTPVFSPGDAVYGYCVMAQGAKIFSYGWN